MDVGQKNLANYHGDVFIGQGSLCAGVFWFGGYVSVAALSLWLSKLCACRGFLAGRLRNGWACRSWGGEEAASLTTMRT